MSTYFRLLLILAFLFAATGAPPVSASGGQPVASDPPPSDPQAPAATKSIFLPVMRKSAQQSTPFEVTGQVTEPDGTPIPGVAIVGGSGRTALTKTDGSYTIDVPSGMVGLAASKDGYNFDPSLINLNVSSDLSGQDFTAVPAAQGCNESITNGGFEVSTYWNLLEGTGYYASAYSTIYAHTGSRSVRTGIINPAERQNSESRVQSQPITVPSGATATLRMWLLPFSGEAVSRPAETERDSTPEVPESAFGDMTMSADVQYVRVLNTNNAVIGTLVNMRSNNGVWTYHQFDLTAYAGRTIKIEIGVYNDAYDGVTALYADDISLQVCSSAPPPPPPQATCNNQLANSNFEYNGAWNVPYTPYPAGYSYDYAYGGSRSMRTGIPLATYSNYESYSDIWQNVFIPSGVSSARLKVRLLLRSEEAYAAALQESEAEAPALDADAVLPKEGQAWDEKALAPDANDVHYILVLNPNTGYILQTLLWWAPRNTSTWQYQEFNLAAYAGQTIRIQVGTYNNGYGGRSVMYVDNLVLDTCGSTTPPPPPTCTERVGNGAFENNSSWYIPYTNFSAGYSTWLARSGQRSMRTGIVYQYHNRYAYSDFKQTVTIPSGASSAVLRFYAYSMSGEAAMSMADKAQQLSSVEGVAAPNAAQASAGDVQYLLVLDQYGNWLDTLVWQRSNAQRWVPYEFNLNRFIGNTITLQWGTYNDGWNGVTAMYIDDVSLVACP